MIEILNYKECKKCSKSELFDFVHLSQMSAIYILKRFFNMIGIDSSLFNHLYNIDIVIDFEYKMDDLGEYESDYNGKNIIRLPSDLLVEDVISIKNNKCIKDKLLFYNTNTIIHEMLHANRGIILNNGVYLNDLLNNVSCDNGFDQVTNYYLGPYYEDIDKKQIRDIIIKQIGLEEAMIEALSLIIMESSNHMSFNKNRICDILLNRKYTDDVMLALKMFKFMKEDIFYWFILSCYEDTYNNRLISIFKRDYGRLISLFAILHKFIIDEDEYDQKIVMKLDNIIERNMK